MIADSTLQVWLKHIEQMLRDPTCEVDIDRGMVRRPDYQTGTWEYEPTSRQDSHNYCAWWCPEDRGVAVTLSAAAFWPVTWRIH